MAKYYSNELAREGDQNISQATIAFENTNHSVLRACHWTWTSTAVDSNTDTLELVRIPELPGQACRIHSCISYAPSSVKASGTLWYDNVLNSQAVFMSSGGSASGLNLFKHGVWTASATYGTGVPASSVFHNAYPSGDGSVFWTEYGAGIAVAGIATQGFILYTV